jgi:hypothetical protein
MTDTIATVELTKLKAVADYVMDIWPDAIGRDSLGGDLQFVMGDEGRNLMGENIVVGNAVIKGPKGEGDQDWHAVGGRRRGESIDLSVVISIRKRGASAREVFDRCHEIGGRISSIQRLKPHETLEGLASTGAALVPLRFEHLLLGPADPKAGGKADVRSGRLSCVLRATGIVF